MDDVTKARPGLQPFGLVCDYVTKVPKVPKARPSVLKPYSPKDFQTFRPKDIQTLRPSDFKTQRPSDLQTFRPSDLQTFRL